jgi:hypothetical protein
MEDFIGQEPTLQDATQIMPKANGNNVMTINKPVEQQTAVPHASNIESFVRPEKGTGKEGAQPTLTISFSVTPKNGEVKGIALMDAVIQACEKIGADISNLSIRKDDK